MEPATVNEPRARRNIGNYRLIARIGTGGMAKVFLALSSKAGGFNKLLVLKVMREEVANDPEFRTMFLDEANIAARLSHPNVVNVFEVGEEEQRFFIAMEYVEGQSFSALLKRTKWDTQHRGAYLRAISDALLGLHHAHDLVDYDGTKLSIVHRDVSPPNVLISYGGHAKIVDFGIAKITGSSIQTKTGILKGKVGYMAPEQVRGEFVDRRADIFAVGVMLWEVLAGRPLVARSDSDVTALTRRLSGDPKISAVMPDAPAELVAICEKAMALDPNDRYATALEMQKDLEAQIVKMPDADASALSALLLDQFAEERKTMKSLIEEQMSVADQSLPLIQINPVEDGSGSGRSRTGTGNSKTEHVAVGGVPDVTPRSRGSRLLVGLGAIALGGVAIGAIYLAGRLSAKADAGSRPAPVPTTEAHPSATASAEPPAAQDAAPTATAFALTVKATPPTAAVSLNGKPIENLASHEVPRGTSQHLIVQAPGFVTFERTITLDRDETVEVVLVRSAIADPRPGIRRPTAPTTQPTAPTTTTTATTKPDDTPLGKKPRRPIDDEDPYHK